MKRRDLLTLPFVAAAARPLGAIAQQPELPVIGYLSPQSPEAGAPDAAAFRQGLEAVGFIEGRDIAIEYRWGDDAYDRLPAVGAEFVARKVRVIFALSVV